MSSNLNTLNIIVNAAASYLRNNSSCDFQRGDNTDPGEFPRGWVTGVGIEEGELPGHYTIDLEASVATSAKDDPTRSISDLISAAVEAALSSDNAAAGIEAFTLGTPVHDVRVTGFRVDPESNAFVNTTEFQIRAFCSA